ncbi:hypothetical protein L6452_20857 [Arctium lappa]|uniref:Uncharacterized protein n=1 Tax=Arctium lappa TaxID=4217 RepID=A0ACB9BDV2_ARCLA|nr:hypothetical protein L6452_20857 [Arctium lappa]
MNLPLVMDYFLARERYGFVDLGGYCYGNYLSKGPVNSKSDTDKGIPKVAGKRRVQADGQASGHWFVGPDRRKESGARFKKTKAKKKASTKKKK